MTAPLPPPSRRSRYADSPQHRDGRFRNAAATPVTPSLGLLGNLRLIWTFLFDKPADTAPAVPLPVEALTRAAL
ncbi:hydrolase, partial [Xanthomonas sp. Kuri4-3]